MSEAIINLHIVVHGQVQGVHFRATTKQVADTLGICGYARNEPNGSVTVIAEGDAEMVYKLIDYCHHGPPNAGVEKVSVTEGKVMGYTTFDIQ